MGKYAFNGSKIDKSCSYSKLIHALEANKPKVQHQQIRQAQHVEQPQPTPKQEYHDETPNFGLGLNLFKVSPSSNYVPSLGTLRRPHGIPDMTAIVYEFDVAPTGNPEEDKDSILRIHGDLAYMAYTAGFRHYAFIRNKPLSSPKQIPGCQVACIPLG